MNIFMSLTMKGIAVLGISALAISCAVPGLNSAKASSSSRNLDPNLASAAGFAVFGGAAGITNAGIQTVITGNIGTTGASTMITGFHSPSFVYSETPLNIGAVNGLVYTNAPEGSPADFAIATTLAADALATFNALAAYPDGIDPGAGQLGGLTLLPGVYKSAAGPFLISGSDLILDAQGDPDAVWVFQMASTLIVGTPTAPQSVKLINGAQAANVYWQVGSAATLNAAGGGNMVGTIIASAGITFSTAGNQTVTVLNGRALSLFAVVTMVNTVVNATGPFVTVEVPVVPTPPIGVTISGTNPDSVVAVPGAGSIIVENNGISVAATETGSGTINIVNNGGVLTATNTGNGVMTINSNATGAVTVTNTGNGNVTVNATGAAAISITHTGDADVVYP